MNINQELSEKLESLHQQENWPELDVVLTRERLIADRNPNWYLYKLTAMSNIETRRASEEIVQIAEEAVGFWQEAPFFCFLVDALITRGEHDDAILALKTWRDIEPENPEIQIRLASCYQKSEDNDGLANAIFHFHLYSGKAKQRALSFSESIDNLNQCHQMAPELDYVSYLYAQGLLYSMQHAAAIEIANKVTHTSTIKPAAKELAMRALFMDGDIQSAVDAAKSRLTDDPKNLVAFRILIRATEAHGDVLESISWCRKVLEIYPFDVLANLKLTQLTKTLVEGNYATLACTDEQKITLAEYLLRSGYSQAGLQLLTDIPENSETYSNARAIAAQYKIANSKYSEALEILNNTQIISVKGNILKQLTAECLYNLGRYTEAANIAEQDLTENPLHHRSNFLLSVCLLQIHRNDRARISENEDRIRSGLKTYAIHHDSDGTPYLHLADLAYLLDDINNIHDFISLARTKGHRSPFASLLMGRYYSARLENEAALMEFNDAVELCSHAPYYAALIARAEILLNMEKFDRAKCDLELVLHHWPNDSRAQSLYEFWYPIE